MRRTIAEIMDEDDVDEETVLITYYDEWRDQLAEEDEEEEETA